MTRVGQRLLLASALASLALAVALFAVGIRRAHLDAALAARRTDSLELRRNAERGAILLARTQRIAHDLQRLSDKPAVAAVLSHYGLAARAAPTPQP